MLRLDLPRLAREGSARLDARIPSDDPMWDGLDVAFGEAVEVILQASYAGSGEIVVRGRVLGTLATECRRCLEPVSSGVDVELTMVFVPSDSVGAEDEGDVRLFGGNDAELELTDPVREEVILAIDPYVVCDPECKGLCPRCGANRNTETCSCTVEELDPRWDALRAIKEE